MRKQLLIPLFFLFSISALAQKGSTLVYGTFNYQHSKNSMAGGGSGGSISINPGIGFGLSDQWTAGVNGTFGKNNINFESTTYGGGPFVRYTKPLSELFSLFGQFETGYFIEKFYTNQKYKRISANLFPAIELNIKNGFALNFSLGGLNFSSSKEDGMPGSYSTFMIQFGTNANLGISKRFGKR